MKKGWEIKTLRDVCEIKTGKKDVNQGNPEGKYPFFTCAKDHTYSDTYSFNTEAILIAGNGDVGNTNYYNGKFEAYQRTYILSNFKSILPKFLFLILKGTLKEKIYDKKLGNTMPYIKMETLTSFKFPLPPPPEQKRIVEVLDEAFSAIDKAKKNTEKNLKNTKELFESYLEDLFSKLFKQSDKKTVSELAKVIGGYSFKSTDFKKEGKYQVIRMGNVRPGTIRENESPVFIDELDDKALARALLLPNDVIITQTGTKKKRDYGFTVIIEKKNYLLNQRITSIRFSDKYLPKFFLYFSWTNIFKDQYFANETGTVGQGNVGIGAISGAIVPFIPVIEQKMIIDRIDEIKIKTQKLEVVYQKKIADLEELKKSILQKAFNGEI